MAATLPNLFIPRPSKACTAYVCRRGERRGDYLFEFLEGSGEDRPMRSDLGPTPWPHGHERMPPCAADDGRRRGCFPGDLLDSRTQGGDDPRASFSVRMAARSGRAHCDPGRCATARVVEIRNSRAAALSRTTVPGDHEELASVIELRPLLHEEVDRLPDKYRLPVILSYLEGRSNEEVASLLGWPVGTVKGRLFRARDLLRSRLTRRGIRPVCGLHSAGALGAEADAAELRTSLVDETTRKLHRIPFFWIARSFPRYRRTFPELRPGPARVEELARSVGRCETAIAQDHRAVRVDCPVFSLGSRSARSSGATRSFLVM